jgi:DNA (cytosine-5)-methyltransferase 1
MNVLDLFSGIGGFSLGLEKVGMKTVAFCEIDSDAQKVLEKHWPSVPIFNDVRTLTKANLPNDEIDVICGGFPCQDVSVASPTKEGLEGKRSGLWSEYLRLIKEIEPSYAIIENVANLRSKGLTRVLKDLWEIGYDAEWHIIPASSVGLPHTRERIWIITYPHNAGLQGCLLKRSESFCIQPEKPLFSGGWLSEWLNTWIRSRIVPRGNGIPRRLACHAVSQYGNAVVPQIPELIGRAILSHKS